MEHDNDLTNQFVAYIKGHVILYVQLIQDRLGIVIKNHQINELQSTVLQACHRFNCTPEDYFNSLRNCDDHSPLLEHLIANITVGETYFFRDNHQMQLLQYNILPTLIAEKRENGHLSLRIWSAGCASGEEIYTIAMLLSEMLVDIDCWTINLLATDINMSSLQKGIEGYYSEWSMRSIPAYYKQRYFIVERNKYHIGTKIRGLVHFSYLNLNDDAYPSIFNETNAQDLILCRNVLIYFNQKSIENLMKKLNTCLLPDRFLLLGASDPINVKQTNLISYQHESALLVKKITPAMTQPTVIKDKIWIRDNATKLEGPLLSFTKNIISEENILPFHLIDDKFTALNAEIVSEKNKNYSDISTKMAIQKMLDEAKWQEALDFIKTCAEKDLEQIFLLNTKATIYANLGQLEQAITFCQSCITMDATNIQAYFTLAMILIELNRLVEAEQVLRRTLFLNRYFVIGHFQLGLLLIRNNQYQAGLKSLHNALTIAATKEPTELVNDVQQLNYGQLVNILKHEMELYTLKSEQVK